MKTLRTFIIIGLVLMTGTTALNAQRGMRWMSDTTRMMRPGRNMEAPQGFGPGRFYCPWHAPVPGPYFYGRHGFDYPVPPAMRPGRIDRPEFNRIPDLTDKQKKDIDALREKFQGEMKKLREENQKKMEEMRKSHKDKIMEILTPDQKKWLEEKNAPPTPRRKI